MARVLSGECWYSEKSHEKQDKVDMRGEEVEEKEGVCTSSISNIAHQIPLDLRIEILTRLPAKSLKRFQCLSKEWLSIIRNQVFIDSFSSLSQTRSRFLVAVRIDENRVFFLSSSDNETERSTAASLATRLEMPIPGWLVNPIRYTSLHSNLEMTVSSFPVDLVHFSSVHGLFGLLHPSDPCRFTVCNPSTRQIITLPDIKASSCRMEGIYMYLGFDPVGNEYKALCSMVLFGEPCQKHKVLTLGGGNLSWRDVKGKKIPRYTVVTNRICIDGMVYYGGWITRRQEKKPRIFCFDVRGERIGSIRTFWPVITDGTLINYNGKLASVHPLPRDPLRRFEIWVLEDLDKRRWLRKYFSVHPLLLELSGRVQLNILGMNKTNEIILGPQKLPPKHEPLYIFYYNKQGGKNLIRRVEIEGFEGFEEFGCNHTSDDEKCVCQVLLSPEHFERLVYL